MRSWAFATVTRCWLVPFVAGEVEVSPRDVQRVAEVVGDDVGELAEALVLPLEFAAVALAGGDVREQQHLTERRAADGERVGGDEEVAALARQVEFEHLLVVVQRGRHAGEYDGQPLAVRVALEFREQFAGHPVVVLEAAVLVDEDDGVVDVPGEPDRLEPLGEDVEDADRERRDADGFVGHVHESWAGVADDVERDGERGECR